MRRRSQKSRRSASANPKRDFWITVGAFAILVIGFILYMPKNQDVDENFCPKDRALITNRYSFLVDTTEALCPSQLEAVQNKVSSSIASLSEFDLVDFYVIQSDTASGARKYKIEISPNSKKPKYIDNFCIPQDRNWERSPLLQETIKKLPEIITEMFFDDFQNDEPQQKSPILKALRNIAASNKSHIKHHIHIFSDMLENTNVLSMYADGWYNNIYMHRRDAFLNSRPQFSENTSVKIWALMRPENSNQNANWYNFWDDMISGKNNNNAVPFTKISGCM